MVENVVFGTCRSRCTGSTVDYWNCVTAIENLVAVWRLLHRPVSPVKHSTTSIRRRSSIAFAFCIIGCIGYYTRWRRNPMNSKGGVSMCRRIGPKFNQQYGNGIVWCWFDRMNLDFPAWSRIIPYKVTDSKFVFSVYPKVVIVPSIIINKWRVEGAVYSFLHATRYIKRRKRSYNSYS